MLDVHAPHHSVHTWRDFFVHIATITVGLLIAVALEQAVTAIHHRHQREYLEDQMREESERNLRLVRSQLRFATQMVHYLDAYREALEAGSRAGELITVTPPQAHVDEATILVSPSRSTWTVAKAAGTVALLPAETAKIYARLDLAGEFEQVAEAATVPKASLFRSSQLRAHVPTETASTVHLTPAARDDLVFASSEYREAMADFRFRLAILEGALEAVVTGIHSLEQMYPYQESAAQRAVTR